MADSAPATPEAREEPSMLSARVLVPLFLVSLIWGSTWLVIKDQVSSVPPTWSVSYRFGVAAIGMFALAWWRGAPLRLDRQGHLIALALGFFQFSANFNFVYRAEMYITSGLIAVLFAMLMVPNAILSRVFLGHRMVAGFVLGTMVALSGIALLFVQEYRAMPADLSDVMRGLGLALCAILSASIANVMQSAERVRTMPILSLLAWAMLWGALGNVVLGWALYGPPVIEMRPAYLGGIVYLGLLGSVVTFPMYFALIRDIGPARAAYSSVLVPVVAMLLSTLFEGYVWSALAAGGAVLGMIGLIIAMRARTPRTPRLAG
jgi:drug/metabolite transporter (DMT)-like permease